MFVRLGGLMIVALVASLPIAFQWNQPSETGIPVLPPQDDEEAVARADFMRTKLLYTQNVFHGLTTGDFDTIKTAAAEVKKVTEASEWVEIDNDLYRKLTAEFMTATDRLIEAAESGNIDATALRYYALSTSCIDCHKHLRKARYDF